MKTPVVLVSVVLLCAAAATCTFIIQAAATAGWIGWLVSQSEAEWGGKSYVTIQLLLLVE